MYRGGGTSFHLMYRDGIEVILVQLMNPINVRAIRDFPLWSINKDGMVTYGSPSRSPSRSPKWPLERPFKDAERATHCVAGMV